MDSLIKDLELQLAALENLITLPELDEPAVMAIIGQLDSLFDVDIAVLSTSELNHLEFAYKRYLSWIDAFTPQCLARKQVVADELRLLQRGKTATEQYQR